MLYYLQVMTDSSRYNHIYLRYKEMKDNRGKYYVRDLKAGDVVQVSVDVKGDVRAVQLLFKANEQKLAIAEGSDTPNKYWEGGTLVMPDLSRSFLP